MINKLVDKHLQGHNRFRQHSTLDIIGTLGTVLGHHRHLMHHTHFEREMHLGQHSTLGSLAPLMP